MNLEDHLGDILAKARHMMSVSSAEAARVAGLKELSWMELEATGKADGKIDWEGISRLLGLNPRKLKSIADGWLPNLPDLGVWRELRVVTTTSDGMGVNCYIVWDEVSREAALFDTGWDAKPPLEIIETNQLVLRHLFITHSHLDHIAGVEQVRETHPRVRLHTSSKSAPVDQRNRANDFIHLGSLRITNRDTPGHAEDGTTYVVGTWPEDAPHVAIVGDAIFAASMGKGNISWDLARQKVRDQILSLPPDTLICPGHGPLTTVQQERDHNPFF